MFRNATPTYEEALKRVIAELALDRKGFARYSLMLHEKDLLQRELYAIEANVKRGDYKGVDRSIAYDDALLIVANQIAGEPAMARTITTLIAREAAKENDVIVAALYEMEDPLTKNRGGKLQLSPGQPVPA